MSDTEDDLEVFPAAMPPALRREAAAAVVRSLVIGMPEGAERKAVWLFHLEGRLTVEQIAERLRQQPATITRWLERFRAMAKRELLLTLIEPGPAR